MSEFLDFLNTADLDTLTEIPGITRPLAEDIIAARPFDFVEDCLKVRGMGKNLLARVQSAFETRRIASEKSALIPVEEEAAPAPIEKSWPAVEANREETPSFWSRLGQALLNFIRALLRLILLVLVIGGIGAALYFGLPYLNKTFIAPVEQNAARVNELENKIAALQTQLNEMSSRLGTIEKSIEAHTASITKLQEMQATLEQETEAQTNSVMIVLKREIMLTRAIETLSRARLYLSQSNFGLAKVDVEAARAILAELRTDVPSYQVNALNQIIARLDLALSNLPAFPVIAVADVDIAWQLLMIGLPESEADVVATFTPLPLPSLTSTPDVSPTFTPTPEQPPTIAPSATP